MGWQGTNTRQHNDLISLLSMHGNKMQEMRWGGIEEKEEVFL